MAAPTPSNNFYSSPYRLSYLWLQLNRESCNPNNSSFLLNGKSVGPQEQQGITRLRGDSETQHAHILQLFNPICIFQGTTAEEKNTGVSKDFRCLRLEMAWVTFAHSSLARIKTRLCIPP